MHLRGNNLHDSLLFYLYRFFKLYFMIHCRKGNSVKYENEYLEPLPRVGRKERQM